ncbi:MAG: glycosyltransferase family 4 protein, partial [Pseudomonadota bacterium]|nr:glycosyltransferase family 4 protein [Pseudomonadota bacterium]
DLSQFTQNSFNSSGLPKRVLFVGAASIRKGIPWLLKAIEPLQTEVECHLVGPIDGIIKDKYASQFPANLIVRGPLSRVDILREFREADIFCLPSVEEGFPLSLLQAMASGLPCVVTNEASGGIIEDNINGIVVASKDSIALEGALKLLVADEQLRREFAIKSRRDVETGFSWNDYGMRAINTYNQMGLI